MGMYKNISVNLHYKTRVGHLYPLQMTMLLLSSQLLFHFTILCSFIAAITSTFQIVERLCATTIVVWSFGTTRTSIVCFTSSLFNFVFVEIRTIILGGKGSNYILLDKNKLWIDNSFRFTWDCFIEKMNVWSL